MILCLTLPLNAVSAATNDTSTAGTSTQDTKVNSTTSTKTTSSSTNYAAGSPKTIKVLIYNGRETSANCVNGLKTSFATANSNNMINGVKFSYATSTKITSSILSGYDLLIMPGGSGGKYYLNDISKSVIQNFVKNGGGYMGICAGAFSAAKHVDGWYDGWGIAPHVYAKAPGYEGQVSVSINSAGANLMKRSGTVSLAYFNGPNMYLKGGGTIFATYADSKTGYKGYAAIVGDYYGNGRTILIGPHPELSPQKPDIIATLSAWATKTTFTNDPTPTPSPLPTTSKASVSQVLTAANSVKVYYEKNKKLPSTVSLNGSKLTMAQFLNVLATATTQINSGSTATINVKKVNAPTKISGSIKKGNFQKSEFIAIANKIKTFINTNGRAPNFISTKLGNLSFTKAIYMFSKVLAFYKTNKRLPNYVSMS